MSLRDRSETEGKDGGRKPSAPARRHPAEAEIRHVNPYTAKQFQLPELIGISRKNIEEHLQLYAGYVEFSNNIVNRMRGLPKDEDHAHQLALFQRRFAYEHNGMTNHELFFEQFEGGPGACAPEGLFLKQISEDFGSFDELVSCLKDIAMTRGFGWTMLYHCHATGHLIPQWVDEHHIGVLSGPRLILALDMWEHAFVYDYPTSERAKYVDALFDNLSWIKVESRFGKTETMAPPLLTPSSARLP
jgi:Fe-Mn family superoxide dismutase